MSDNTDVLVKWVDVIKDADRPGDHPAYQRCIGDLAAELRALRALYKKSLNHNIWLEDEWNKSKARVTELKSHIAATDPWKEVE